MDPQDATRKALANSRAMRHEVLEELRRVTGWELTFLARIEDDELEVLDTAGVEGWVEPSTAYTIEDTLCARMIAGEAPATTDRASAPDDHFHDAPVRELWDVESYSGHVVRGRDGTPLGTLCAIDRESREPTREARRLGEMFARLLSYELEREAMLRDLSRRARTDPLTGLSNRAALDERLAGELADARRYGRELGLVLIDLDRFAAVTVRHGHLVGDAVLIEVAGMLREQARAGDLVARMGGERFAWLLPETDAEAALVAAERARRAIGEATFSAGVRMTASAGVAALAHAVSGDELHRLAGRALYAAKAAGRDRCVGHAPSAAPAAARLPASTPDQAALALHGLVLELGWPAGRVALEHESGRRHDLGRLGVLEEMDLKPAG